MNTEVWIKLKVEFLICTRGTCSLTVGDWTSLCRQKYLVMRSARRSNSRNIKSSQGKSWPHWTGWELCHMMYFTAFLFVMGPTVPLGLWVWVWLPVAYRTGTHLGTYFIFFFACVHSPAPCIGCFTQKPSYEGCQTSSRYNRSLSGWPGVQNVMICHSRMSFPQWEVVDGTGGTTSPSSCPCAHFPRWSVGRSSTTTDQQQGNQLMLIISSCMNAFKVSICEGRLF